MVKPALVVDTSPLLYLGRLGRIDLLPGFFEPIYVPEEVVLELDAGRLLRADTPNVRELGWAIRVAANRSAIEALPPNRLGPGELSVIAHARVHKRAMVGLDDRQARVLAGRLGLSVVGTVGILVKAKHAGLIPCVRDLLNALRTVGFRLNHDVFEQALRLVGET